MTTRIQREKQRVGLLISFTPGLRARSTRRVAEAATTGPRAAASPAVAPARVGVGGAAAAGPGAAYADGAPSARATSGGCDGAGAGDGGGGPDDGVEDAPSLTRGAVVGGTGEGPDATTDALAGGGAAPGGRAGDGGSVHSGAALPGVDAGAAASADGARHVRAPRPLTVYLAAVCDFATTAPARAPGTPRTGAAGVAYVAEEVAGEATAHRLVDGSYAGLALSSSQSAFVGYVHALDGLTRHSRLSGRPFVCTLHIASQNYHQECTRVLFLLLS
eukprot:SAG11_NODE_71_length_18338_cov_14.752974_6_plen_275_part_00